MLYIAIFDAREEATLDEINREREEWIKKGRHKVFEEMCKSIERYEVIGSSPLRIIFVIETDQPQALNYLSHHFGDLWYSTAYPALQRGIYEALEEDRTIVAG
jgi:hypothetical protein